MDLATAAAHVGDGVVYDPGNGQPREDGVITSVNSRYVFVRYHGDTGSKATPAQALRLAGETPARQEGGAR